MTKKILPLLFLSASGLAVATEIQDLVNTSQSIRDTFDGGIKTISGMSQLAYDGVIAPDMASNYHITADQATAYNDALANVQNANITYDAGAQEYFNTQSQNSLDNMQSAISAYVQAAGAVIEVVKINDMASEATGSEAVELQNYITDNDVTLQQAEVDLYNESLDNVQSTAQEAAAFMAVANDPALIDSANTQASEAMAYFSDAKDAFFDGQNVTVDFNSYALTVSLSVASYFTTDVEVLSVGEQGSFYLTGPTANPCFFIQDPVQRDECVAANGI